jgi:hypothetical protein
MAPRVGVAAHHQANAVLRLVYQIEMMQEMLKTVILVHPVELLDLSYS